MPVKFATRHLTSGSQQVLEVSGNCERDPLALVTIGREGGGPLPQNKRRWRWSVYDTGCFKLPRSMENGHVHSVQCFLPFGSTAAPSRNGTIAQGTPRSTLQTLVEVPSHIVVSSLVQPVVEQLVDVPPVLVLVHVPQMEEQSVVVPKIASQTDSSHLPV